ncbi:MAG: pyrophosphatase [Polyangiaceae bacterium]|jgi:NTP pyrophosphatase (non-canonical NTP hydrolase)|nr:pyrophosphatase [Polyangiaceae bacterium]
MSLTLSAYQERAKATDLKPAGADGLVIALLGLVGEAGSLLTEYKKRMVDGEAHQGFKAHLAEELGDLLWYLATIATRNGLSLEDAAQRNLEKTRSRWLPPDHRAPLFDEGRAADEQLPRQFEYKYESREVEGRAKVLLVDERGTTIGDPLTDNAHEDDGYRFHDVLHLAHAVVLGWSPVYRKLLGRKRKSNDAVDHVDEVEDGARAQLAEELVAAATYEYAARHLYLQVDHVDWDLLRLVKRITAQLEVNVRTEAEWEEAMLLAFNVWRQVRDYNGGTLRGDLLARTLEFVPPKPASESGPVPVQ